VSPQLLHLALPIAFLNIGYEAAGENPNQPRSSPNLNAFTKKQKYPYPHKSYLQKPFGQPPQAAMLSA